MTGAAEEVRRCRLVSLARSRTATRSTGFGPVVQKDIDPSTVGGQYDGKTFTFTIPPNF